MQNQTLRVQNQTIRVQSVDCIKGKAVNDVSFSASLLHRHAPENFVLLFPRAPQLPALAQA
jgi:hypothetical protein